MSDIHGLISKRATVFMNSGPLQTLYRWLICTLSATLIMTACGGEGESAGDEILEKPEFKVREKLMAPDRTSLPPGISFRLPKGSEPTSQDSAQTASGDTANAKLLTEQGSFYDARHNLLIVLGTPTEASKGGFNAALVDNLRKFPDVEIVQEVRFHFKGGVADQTVFQKTDAQIMQFVFEEAYAAPFAVVFTLPIPASPDAQSAVSSVLGTLKIEDSEK
jgi:hypothetical protein